MTRFLLALIISFVAVVAASAQERADTVVTIISSITRGGRNTVAQPDALTRLLRRADKVQAPAPDEEGRQSSAGRQRVGGYRVQIFLDNNASTAKANARRKASEVSSRFPEMRTYVTYNAPYWRLRVGDFRSQSEANEAAAKLRAAFPGSAKEIRVVRDNINR